MFINLTPLGSNHQLAIESLKKIMELPLAYLYLGHYGICDKPKEGIAKLISNMDKLLDIGTKYVRKGKPEGIGDEVWH